MASPKREATSLGGAEGKVSRATAAAVGLLTTHAPWDPLIRNCSIFSQGKKFSVHVAQVFWGLSFSRENQ